MLRMRSGVDEAQWNGHEKILALLLATTPKHRPLQEEKWGEWGGWGGWGRGERDERVASHDNADSNSDGLRVVVEERPSDSSGLQGWFEVRVPSAAGKFLECPIYRLVVVVMIIKI